jgi:uncharacterized protein (TIGR03437 family)
MKAVFFRLLSEMKPIFLLILCLGVVRAQQSYSIATFDVPGSTSTAASGINDAGQVVGSHTTGTDGTRHCFLRSADGASYTTIDPPRAIANSFSCAGINNLGQISGSFSDATGFHGFIRSAVGAFTTFDLAPGASVGGINDLGEVVGAYTDAINGGNGYVRRADRTMETIKAPFLGDTLPVGINNKSEIVGWGLNGSSQGIQHGFIRGGDGAYRQFDLPGTTNYTRVLAMNDGGTFIGSVVGYSESFISNADGSFHVWSYDGAYWAWNGINNSGVLAGTQSVNGKEHAAIATPGGALTNPVVRPGGFLPASGFATRTIASPGTWVEIFGEKLASTTRPWTAADFHNGAAPTSLDGVTVSIGAVPAYVSYVSPGQVNALVPSTVAPGAVQVTVTSGGQTSDRYTANLGSLTPALLTTRSRIDPNSASVVAFSPAGAVTRANPGETVVLYGIGFGAVSPAVADGTVASGPATLVAPVQVYFDNVAAQVVYAGLVPGSIGLYQFNVVVPPLAAGGTTAGISLTVGGVPANDFMMLSIAK